MYRPAFKSRVDIQVEQLPTDPNHPAEESYKQFGEGSVPVSAGNYDRYFIESIVDGSVVEINFNEYSREVDGKKIYTKYKINWETSSPKVDFLEGEYVRYGSNSKNIQQVQKYPKVFEFLATKGELLVEYLEALPKQYIVQNGDFYSGLYHIHPVGGPLADPVHTSAPHKVLYSPGTRLNEFLPRTFTAPAIQYDRSRQNTYNSSL